MNAGKDGAAKKLFHSFDFQDLSHRVLLFGLILLFVVCLAVGIGVAWRQASSLALGGALSLLNFKWLKDLVDRALYQHAAKGGRWIWLKFLGRYGLILLVFYGILRLSQIDLLCAFLGLFTTIGALFIECVYQVRRSFVKTR